MAIGLAGRPDHDRRLERGRGNARAGFGLVEVVISVGLLVTLAVGVAQLFGLSAQSLVRARHRTSSLVLTVEKIEQLRAELATQDVDRVPVVTGLQVEHLAQDGRLTSGAWDGARFERIWQLGSGMDNVITVAVQVAPVLPSGSGSLDGAVPRDGVRVLTLVPVR